VKIFFIQFIFIINVFASVGVIEMYNELSTELEKFNNLKSLLQNCNTQIEKENTMCETLKYFTSEGVPRRPLEHALTYYFANKDKLKNQRFISIADYSQRSTKNRFYLLDLVELTVSKYKVSHGSGSRGGIKYGDPNHDGHIDKCEHNGSRTNMTRPGFFKTAELYLSTGTNSSHIEKKNSAGVVVKGWPYLSSSKKLNALRLDGLSPGINTNARANGVVMHGSWYNNKEVTGSDIMGRSYGCPAFSTNAAQSVLPKINGGSLYYSYVPKCSADQATIEAALPRSNILCIDSP
jgi:hypothetical protein